MNDENERDIATSLVNRILSGDRTAEDQMVERYNRGLLLLLKRKSNVVVAEDVAQESWRVVLEKVRAGELRDPGSLSAFIVQVGRNQLLMYLRKHGSRDTSEHLENDQEISTDGPREILVRDRIREAVHELLKELPTDRDRTILKRYYLSEDDKSVICRDLELSELHFNRVLYRAKQRFRGILEDYQLTATQ